MVDFDRLVARTLRWLRTDCASRNVEYIEICVRYGIDAGTAHAVVEQLHKDDRVFMLKPGRTRPLESPTWQWLVRVKPGKSRLLALFWAGSK